MQRTCNVYCTVVAAALRNAVLALFARTLCQRTDEHFEIDLLKMASDLAVMVKTSGEQYSSTSQRRVVL